MFPENWKPPLQTLFWKETLVGKRIFGHIECP